MDHLETTDLLKMNCLKIRLALDLFFKHYEDVKHLCQELGNEFQRQGLLYPSLYNFKRISLSDVEDVKKEETYPNFLPIILEDAASLNCWEFRFTLIEDDLYKEELWDCAKDGEQIQRRIVFQLEKTIRSHIDELLSKRDMVNILKLTKGLNQQTISKIESSRESVRKLTEIYRDLFKKNLKINSPLAFFETYAEISKEGVEAKEIIKEMSLEIYS